MQIILNVQKVGKPLKSIVMKTPMIRIVKILQRVEDRKDSLLVEGLVGLLSNVQIQLMLTHQNV
jgi:dethiobiotin synthetase